MLAFEAVPELLYLFINFTNTSVPATLPTLKLQCMKRKMGNLVGFKLNRRLMGNRVLYNSLMGKRRLYTVGYWANVGRTTRFNGRTGVVYRG